MPDVQLIWPNKNLALRASGDDGYVWMQPDDPRMLTPLKFYPITDRPLDSGSNVLAIGDGLVAQIPSLVISMAAGEPEVGVGVGGAIAILGGAFIVRSLVSRPTPAAGSESEPASDATQR